MNGNTSDTDVADKISSVESEIESGEEFEEGWTEVRAKKKTTKNENLPFPQFKKTQTVPKNQNTKRRNSSNSIATKSKSAHESSKPTSKPNADIALKQKTVTNNKVIKTTMVRAAPTMQLTTSTKQIGSLEIVTRYKKVKKTEVLEYKIPVSRWIVNG